MVELRRFTGPREWLGRRSSKGFVIWTRVLIQTWLAGYGRVVVGVRGSRSLIRDWWIVWMS